MTLRRRCATLCLLLLLALHAACDSPAGTVEREVTLLLKLGGDLQTGAPGAELANPLIVGAYDFESRPMAGVEVSFNVRTGNGTVTPGLVRTDANGLAQSRWTLGGAAGEQEATASVRVDDQSLIAEFRATAAN